MSEHVTPPTPASGEPRIVGTLAEFTGPKELIAAVRAIRKKGYKRVEAFSPFPIHGIDDALEAKPSILPWVVLGAGIAGCVVAVLMQWYMNAYEAAHPFSGYRYAISGKPFWSLPANIPVTFELIILFSAFTAFLGMIAFNKLPQFANPLFASKRFRKVTDDRFFLLVDAHDSLYAESSVRTALESIGSSHVETIRDLPAEPLPRVIRPLMGLLAVVALLPLAYFALVSTGTSQNPRIYIWWDMDFQPKFKAQTLVKAAETELVKRNREEHKAPGFSERLFPQGRASRLPVDGTVARGTLMLDYRLRTGIEPDGEETTPVALQEAEASAAAPEGAAGEAGTEGAATPPEPNWITRFPDSIVVNQQTMDRGRQRYDIYCAVCHGVAGDGDGLVSQRAMMLQQGTWTQAAKLDAEAIRNQPVGKIYDTITNGRGRMRGYRAQIPVEDRWAITLYVKALQRSRNVSVDALPEGISVDDLAPMVRDPNAEQSEGDEPGEAGDAAESQGEAPAEDAAESTPAEPEADEPAAGEPEMTEPEATEPELTEPDANEPEPTEPEPTEPEATEPEPTEPEPTGTEEPTPPTS